MERRGAMTVRITPELIERAKRVKAARESFNDLVVEALEREVRRRQGLEAYAKIRRIRTQVEERTGLQPDSADLIRAMREEERGG